MTRRTEESVSPHLDGDGWDRLSSVNVQWRPPSRDRERERERKRDVDRSQLRRRDSCLDARSGHGRTHAMMDVKSMSR